MFQVLYEYVREGTVEVVQNWGKGLPQHSTHYFGQTLSINECVYRNMYRVKYLVFTDLDEFIVPRKSLGWPGMMKKIENLKYGTYLFRHSYFFKANVSENEFNCNGVYRVKFPEFLTRTVRSRKIFPPEVKSKYILKPLFSSSIGVHEVFQHMNDRETFVVSPDYAMVNHYRLSIPDSEQKNQPVSDKSALVYKIKIIGALKRRLCRLNLIFDISER